MHAAFAIFGFVISFVLVDVLSAENPDGAYVVFQNGRDEYDGARLYSISTQYADSWNYYNGMSYGVVPTQYHSIQDTMYHSNKSNGEVFRGLIRFDKLEERIPAGATVTEATLVLQLTTWERTPATLYGAYLTRGWDWNQTHSLNGDPNKITGWRFSGPGTSWSQPGALNDTLPDKRFALEMRTVGASIREVPLDPTVVQTWLNPETNFGIVTFVNDTASIVLIASYTSASAEFRDFSPMLVIKYQQHTDAPVAPIAGMASAVNRSIYVDAALGNDRWNGHRAAPLQTLAVAVSVARPGDVILLRSGVYGGCQISLTDITITSAPGHWGVIAAPLYDPSQNTAIFVRDTAHRFRLSRVEVTGGYYYAVATFTSWEFYNIGPIRELNGSGPLDLIVEDCRLHTSGSSVIKLSIASRNATIRRNLIHNAGRRSATYGHGIEVVNARGGTFVDNYIFDCPGAGVKLSGGCKNTTVSRNMIERTHLAGILLGFYEQTEYMDWISNPKWFECRSCSAVSNIIFDVHGTGIGLYASENSFVAHNTLYSVAHTMMAAIVLSSVQHWVNNSANGSPVVGNRNPRIHNNIVVKGKYGRPGNMMLQIREVTSYVDGSLYGALEPNTTFNASFNVYHSLAEPSPVQFVWGRGVMLEDERVATAFVGNLSMWQAHWPGWEVGSVDADPVLSTTFTPTSCRPLRAPPVPILQDGPGPTLLDFDGNAILPDADGLVLVGARQGIADNVTADASVVFPSIRVAFDSLPPPYEGKRVPPQSYVIWPYREMEIRSPRTFVIAPWGTDNDQSMNATYGFPFRTANYAMQRMWPGDTLLLRGGQYTTTLRIFLPNITISSFPDEWAVINVSNSDTNVANAVYFADNANGNFGGSGEVTLRRLEIVGGYYYGIMFNQAGGGTTNSYWNWWKAQHGITSPSVTVVEDCVIHSAGSHLIKISPESNDIILRRLKLYRSGSRGDTPAPPPANPSAGQSNPETPPQATSTARIQGNGIDIRGGNRIVIEDCELSDITGTALLLGGGASDCVVQRNLIVNVGGIGIMVGSFNTEAMYMRLIENPKLFQAQRTVVRNNVVFNVSGAGLGLYSSKDTVAVHNTFTSVAQTMHAALLFNIAPNYENPISEVLPPNEGAIILNNIFHMKEDARGYMLENRVWTASTATVDPPSFPGSDNCSVVLAREMVASTSDVWAAATHHPVATNSGIDGGCPLLPPDHPMNTRIDNLDVHPLSEEVMRRLRSPGCRCLGGDLKNCFTAGSRPCGFLHPDFGGTVTAENGASVLSGFKITRVNSSTPRQSIPFNMYGDESDNVPYPFPPDAGIENTPSDCPIDVCSGDRHVLALDTENCVLYETWRTEFVSGSWQAANGAVFNLTSNRLRPLGWTSADAAGLPILPGLVKFDEFQRGEIRHAIRVTFANTRKAYVLPATHYAAPTNVEYLPAMGHRFRLKKSFDCSQLARAASIVCVALQRYGAIVADNGANWFLSGEAHPDWPVNELEDVKRIPAEMMELVDTGDACITSDCRPVPATPVYPTVSAFPDLSTLTMDGNVYWKDAADYRVSPAEFVNRDPVTFWRGLITNISEWAKPTGADVNSKIGDPQFGDGFRLTPESAAFDASPLAASFAGTTDFFGRLRRVSDSLTVDAGAISFYHNDNQSLRGPNASLPQDPLNLFVDPCRDVAQPTTVYVATNGSDSSCTGSIDAPFATLRKAARRVTEGGTILLFPGVHDGGITIGRNSLTIQSLGPRRAIIRSSPLKGSDALTIAGDQVTLENIEVVGGYTASVSVTGRFVRVLRCELHGAGAAVVRLERSATGAVVQECVIRNSGQRTPRFGDGIFSAGASWLLILNNTIRSIRSTAIHIREGSAYAEISRNFIFNARRGISIGNDNANNSPLPDFDDYHPLVDSVCTWLTLDNPTCFAALHTRVLGNVVHNVEGFGIGLMGTRNASVLHNTLRRCASADSGAIYLTAVQHWIDGGSSPIVTNQEMTVKNNLVTIRWESYRPAWFIRTAADWGTVPTSVRGFHAASAVIEGNWYHKEVAGGANLPFPDAFYRRFPNPITNRSAIFFFDGSLTPNMMSWVQWSALLSGAMDRSSNVADPQLNASFPLVLAADSPAAIAAVTISGPDMFDAFGTVFPGSSGAVGAVQPPSNDYAILRFGNLQSLLTTAAASPGSSIPSENVNRGKQCDGSDCWHPWLATSAPQALSMTRMLQTCLNGGRMFPAGHEMSRDLRNDRTHPLSDAYKTRIGTSNIHPDFGTIYDGHLMGIPYVVLKGSAFNRTLISFRYAEESDVGPYPIPFNAPVESGDDVNGDRHIIVLDAETCKVYELFKSVFIDPEYHNWLGVGLSADSGAIFDMSSRQSRPLGWTSADAAGLSVFAGLVFKEEIDAGVIQHAVRYTVMQSQMAYLAPATHFASTSRQADLSPMGLRARLKPWFNCTLSVPNPIFTTVCNAMKMYGLILADNGGNWFVSGSADSRWNNAFIDALYNIPVSALEIVDTTAALCTSSSCT